MRFFILFIIVLSLSFGAEIHAQESVLPDDIQDIQNEIDIISEEEIETGVQAYASLQKALLEKLHKLDKQMADRKPEDVKEPITFPEKTVRQGFIHPNNVRLRERLDSYFTYDIIHDNPEYFDTQLEDAVKAFQAEKGLKSDGVIGPQTLEVLNHTLEDDRKQILRNLVRLKSDNFQNRPPLRIEVDIARYWLTAYEDNKVVMEMPVVVGTKARSTNRFKTMMTGVRLNPGWTLPPTIKSEDYIPKLRQNPEWVSDQGILIYSSWDRDAQPIDPMTIDWHFLPDNAIRAMRFYKLAGDNNPLGRYRFLMNNQYDIYLHDTNQKYLFDRDQRAYSSGCVRISDPQKLALFLLKDDEQWTTERLNDVIESGETRNVRATRSIPVYFDYKTAWLNEEGDLILGHDIYDLDLGVDYSSFDYKKRDSYTETNTQNFNFN